MNNLLDSTYLTRDAKRWATPLIVGMDNHVLHKDVIHGGRGYIAGTADGIVTVAGKPAARRIYLIDAQDMHMVRSTWSQSNGEYFIVYLNPNKEYLVLARDHLRQYEPVAWDYVQPATNMTLAEQLQLLRDRGYQVSDNHGEFSLS